MRNDQVEPVRSSSTEARYYYTCWPFPIGGWICGLFLVGTGVALVLQQLFPDAGEAIWGGALIVLGLIVLAAAARSDRGGLP